MNVTEERTKRTEWFLQDRFGMFIHWGLYAIPARGEWVRSAEKISVEDYQAYFDEFNPADYNPRDWARAAKQAGMKYAVLTAKHHDGFCLFDSALTDYKSTNTKAGRDLVREFLDAFRAEGLKVGLYYSLLDWHHEHYPAYGDSFHPMRENEGYKRDPQAFTQYVDYMHGQVKELLTNYGRLDVMWFDFSYKHMSGKMWRAHELMQMIRTLQPHIVVDNRLASEDDESASIYSRSPSFYSGDFASPEQIIPPRGVTDEDGKSIPWEACITLNNNWGYSAMDRAYKSSTTIIRKLVECVSKNGNLLLNIGPTAKGEFPPEALQILLEVGDWMKGNQNSIYSCTASELPKPEWGRYTQNGSKLYAHVFEESIGPVCLAGLEGKVKNARLLSDGSELFVTRPWNAGRFPEDAFVSFTKPESLPDKRDTVIELELI